MNIIKHLIILTILAGSLFFLPPPARASNVTVTSVSLLAQNSGTRPIQFTVSWDNSWFVSGAPGPDANWDAVWVFAKFRKNSGTGWSNWAHATLDKTVGNHTAPAGSQITLGCSPGVDCSNGANTVKGIFFYRSATGTPGTVTFTNSAINWLYSTDGVADGDWVDVKVFAIEMVYVPSGSFWIGDPSKNGTDPFYSYGCTSPNCAYQITSENAITVGTTNGNLYYTNSVNGGDRGTPIPAAFPKGYNAFYIMKTEVSQKQYAEFLNTLNPGQQSARWVTGYFNSNRYFIKKSVDARFGVDGNNNAGADGSATYNSMNESDDGGWVACNYLSWMDNAAFAEWAALRPMTEFEFEKAARGDQPAVAGEYAWGNTTLTPPSSGTPSLNRQAGETTNGGNCNYNSVISGPIRVGSYAGSGTSRTAAGAGYYGALDLSGNLWEFLVTVGNLTGRGFTGVHGSGALSGQGYAVQSLWPGWGGAQNDGATGLGLRGGTWSHTSTNESTADRFVGVASGTNRVSDVGFRACRTSP
ncbi:MAG: SUMF1/EgtB/PvdO family nonheme iron enzyme [Candidatus Omnitrophica bacterium]|nr:SUMF1/EgtB/PvdO family nonheme iron enzyme [Candidatus Omnitrophota bacterium]